jgi:hypothetical protein
MKGVPVNIREIAKRVVHGGESPLYIRQCLFPVLNVEVKLLERSREEMGELQHTLLGLVASGVGSPTSLAGLTGLGQHRLPAIMEELQGRSLVKRAFDGTISITELGKESLAHGSELSETSRALLLCGLTGKLLPKRLYYGDRYTMDEVRKPACYSDFIIPVDKVPLTGLDLSKIGRKRDYALPDEALRVLEIIASEPLFMRGIVAVSSPPEGGGKATVHFDQGVVDWIAANRVVPLIEPLGFSARLSEKECMETLARQFEQLGLTVEFFLEGGGVPKLKGRIVKVSRKAAEQFLYGQPLLQFVGTSRFKPLPIGKFPERKGDVLFGYCMYLELAPDMNELLINQLRSFEESFGQYWKTPRHERDKHWQVFVKKKLKAYDVSVAGLKAVLKHVRNTKMQEFVDYFDSECAV